MNEPTIASKKPSVLELEAGTYYWCSCGQSANQPYCDGSHKGTGFTPVSFTVEAKKRVALCNCKRSANGPFCDGAHKNL
ncbi:MAG: CDGSH iron-sulfur domain-containing protein [Myxococcota bacterium]|nr:CDGSH iron-sulfur domain-containing protein [Myxococcota bacterium]